MRIWVCILLIMVLAIPVIGDPVFDAEEILSKSTVNATAIVIRGEGAELDYIEAQLQFFPRESGYQNILSIDTNGGVVEEDSIRYYWDEAGNVVEVLVKNDLRTYYFQPKITEIIPFPVRDIPEDVKVYTESSPLIDSDDEAVIEIASEIVDGETDLYKAVFKIGVWVQNEINYSLNSLTEKVSQKSSWVLDNRFGVCDEITTLFIAMNRAVGTPARFVSGMAYTNFNDMNDYGPHAWAEVYIGDQWVPFDITYGEYGYVDAGHIKMSVSRDSSPSSIEYTWRGREVEIETEPLDIVIIKEDVQGIVDEGITLEAEFVKEKIGFGSYNLLEVTVSNQKNYYVGTELSLSRSQDMEIIGGRKPVLLAPGEIKKIYWITQIHDDLDRLYIYTIPVLVYTSRNLTTEAEFKAMKGQPVYSLEDVESIREDAGEEKETSQNVGFECRVLKPTYMLGESIAAECTVKNEGNTIVRKLSVCGDEECRIIDIGISQEKLLEFALTEESVGEKEVYFRARNNKVSELTSLKFTVLDEPKVGISDVKHPEEVRYGYSFNVSFLIKKESFAEPEDVEVFVRSRKNEESWRLGTLVNNRRIVMTIPASVLKPGINEFEIIITYNGEDERDAFEVELVDVTFWQRIVLFFRNLI